MVWLLYDKDLHHERVNVVKNVYFVLKSFFVLDVFEVCLDIFGHVGKTA